MMVKLETWDLQSNDKDWISLQSSWKFIDVRALVSGIVISIIVPASKGDYKVKWTNECQVLIPVPGSADPRKVLAVCPPFLPSNFIQLLKALANQKEHVQKHKNRTYSGMPACWGNCQWSATHPDGPRPSLSQQVTNAYFAILCQLQPRVFCCCC